MSERVDAIQSDVMMIVGVVVRVKMRASARVGLMMIVKVNGNSGGLAMVKGKVGVITRVIVRVKT